MSNSTPSGVQKVRIKTEKREDLYYPLRVAIRIEIGDWQRWIRMISSISKREAIFRDIAFASLGISIPTLLSAITTSPRIAQLPIWVSIVYLTVGAITLAVGVACLFFDSKMGKVVSSDIEEVLQDMEEVYERSVRSEETIIPTVTT